MKIYFSYLARSLLTFFLTILFIIVLIVWLTQSLKFIELITGKGISFNDFLMVTGLLIPPMIYAVLPVAFFISIIALFSHLNNDKELVVLKTSGLSDFQIAKPVIFISLFVMVAHFLVSFYLLPKSYREFKELQEHFKNKLVTFLLEEGVFNTQSNNLTVYIEEKINDTYFKGIFIYNSENKEKPITIMADTGHIIKTNEGPKFILFNGTHQELNVKNNNVSLITFDKYEFGLKQYYAIPENRIYDSNEMYIGELWEQYQSLDSDKINKSYFVNLHQRIIWPVYSVVLSIVGSSFMLLGGYKRKNQWVKNASVAITGAVFIVLSLISNNLAMGHHSFVWAMYLNVILCLLIGGLAFNSKYIKKFKLDFAN